MLDRAQQIEHLSQLPEHKIAKILAEMPSLLGYQYVTGAAPLEAFGALCLSKEVDAKRYLEDVSFSEAERLIEVIPPTWVGPCLSRTASKCGQLRF